MTHILVTGAAGFVGRALVRQILADTAKSATSHDLVLTLMDMEVKAADDPRVNIIEGNFADAALLSSALSRGVDTVYHLASVPGGTAEREYSLGRGINLDATLRLIDECASLPNRPRFVFASSIAVYGQTFPTKVNETTTPTPATSYGTHKLVAELMLADATRRGRLEGCSLRLPAVVARPLGPSGLVSAFMSNIFWAIRDERPITLPVSASARAWWISRDRCVENLVHAGTEHYQRFTSCTHNMPVLHIRIRDLLDAISNRFNTDWGPLVSFEPDQSVEALFGAYPPLETSRAIEAGFRNDGTVDQMLERIYSQDV